MKNFKYLLFLIALLPAFVQAQSTEAVLDRYLEKIGGEEAIKSFTDAKIDGKMTMMGMEIPLTMFVKNPGMIRVEANIMGQKMIQASNGSVAWTINPMAGITSPQQIPAEQVTDNDIGDDVALHFGDPDYTFTYKGEETVGDVEYYRIDVEAPTGMQEQFYSKETGLREMVRTKVATGPTAGSYVETFFSDYTEVMNGYMIPFKILAESGGAEVMNMELLEVNAERIDSEIFEMPEN